MVGFGLVGGDGVVGDGDVVGVVSGVVGGGGGVVGVVRF